MQSQDIAQKIQDAPDAGYEIGVFIGSYLPFVVLVIIAYVMYRRAKSARDLKD